MHHLPIIGNITTSTLSALGIASSFTIKEIIEGLTYTMRYDLLPMETPHPRGQHETSQRQAPTYGRRSIFSYTSNALLVHPMLHEKAMVTGL